MAMFTIRTNADDDAIRGISNGNALRGETGATSEFRAGVSGIATYGDGIGPGVYGQSDGNGAGVHGESVDGRGGFFKSKRIEGVYAESSEGRGGYFKSESYEGLCAETEATNVSALVCRQLNPSSTSGAFWAEHATGGLAATFRGNVVITGDCSFPGADFSEDFTIAHAVAADPGTVMTLGRHGELEPCAGPYEKRVVGVVAGAGSYRTGIVMDRQSPSPARRRPIALVGKVFCKADARYGPIEVGDLLTSSATPGHAMKASDPARAFGSVIGKALAPLDDGPGLIPILIALQ